MVYQEFLTNGSQFLRALLLERFCKKAISLRWPEFAAADKKGPHNSTIHLMATGFALKTDDLSIVHLTRRYGLFEDRNAEGEAHGRVNRGQAARLRARLCSHKEN